MTRFKAALLAASISLAAAGAAHAGTYQVFMNEGLSNGNGFATTINTDPYVSGATNIASAQFTYTGALNFSDTLAQNSGPTGDLNSTFGFSTANISNYSGSGTVYEGNTLIANNNTLAGFLASSGSAANYQYGSFYAIDLGNLAAGTVLTITHDDGASVYQNGIQVGSTVTGPTPQYTDTVALGSNADTFLLYSRQNGTPSVLQVAVPEPMSLSLLGAGLIGLGAVRRRKAAKTVA